MSLSHRYIVEIPEETKESSNSQSKIDLNN
jgi:hypothetical protein